MYTTINLMLPTYHRVDRARQFIESAVHMADNPDCLRFTFVVNVEDTDTRRYIAEQQTIPEGHWAIIDEDTDQPNLSLYFNLAYDQTPFACATEVVTMVGDDMVFLTHGWDGAVLAEVNAANGAILLHVNDAYIAGERLCVNLFTTRRVVEATEREFMCPKYHAEMIDVIWHMIGNYTGLRRYRQDIVLQHNHGSNINGGARDATFMRLSPLRMMTNDEHANRKWWANAYATYSASKIIDAGMGTWNNLAT